MCKNKSIKTFKLSQIILVFSLVFFLCGCSAIQKLVDSQLNTSSITQISLSNNSLTINIGESVTLHPTYSPKKANPTLKWESSNSNIVNVSDDGELTALSAGSATITVKSALNNDVYASCVVTVVKSTDNAAPTTVKLIVNKKQISIENQETSQINATIFPFEYLQDLTWKSSNTNVATVSDDGLVTAISKGQAVITIKSEIYDLSATVKVFVGMPAVQSISVDSKKIILEINASKQMTASVIPANAAQEVTWLSLNGNIASVTSTGLVKAKAVGTTTIKVKSEADLSKYTNIEVFVIKTSTETNTNNSTNTDINTILQNNNITEEDLSSTENITSLLDNLLEDNTAGLNVNNTNNVTLYINPESQRLIVGESINIIDYIFPQNTISNYTFSSSDTSVVTVDTNGHIEAISAGLANITINSPDTNQVLRLELLISYPINSITIDNGHALTLTKGESELLTASILPQAASQEVTWKSSNTTLVKITSTGQITAIAEGSATITGTSTTDSTKKANIVVTVVAPEQPVNNAPQIYSVPETQATVNVAYTYQISVTDYEDDSLTYQIISKPNWLTFDSQNKLLYGTPTRANVGENEVSIKVSDGTNEVTQTFNLNVSLKEESFIGEWLATEGDFTLKGINCVNKLVFKFNPDGKITIRHLTLAYKYDSTWEVLPDNKIDIKEATGTSHIYNVIVLDKDNLSLFDANTGKSRIFKKY
jgi:uncharacterized protein YjdB